MKKTFITSGPGVDEIILGSFGYLELVAVLAFCANAHNGVCLNK